jgi:acyl dehydratase
MPEFTLSGIAQHVGKELGVSSWVTVDQSRINQFAECSGDRQWIHVDVARAKRESPYRAPIAHGYLTLALVAPLQMEIGAVPTDAARHSTMAWTRSASLRRSRLATGCGYASHWSMLSRKAEGC